MTVIFFAYAVILYIQGLIEQKRANRAIFSEVISHFKHVNNGLTNTGGT